MFEQTVLLSSYVKTTSPAGSLNKQGGTTKGCFCFLAVPLFKLPSLKPAADSTHLLPLKANLGVVPLGGKERSPTFLLEGGGVPSCKRYLISFSGCTILKKRDNGRLEIHVSESHIRLHLNPFISYALAPSPLVCPTPLSSRRTKYRSTPCLRECAGLWRHSAGEISTVLNQTTSSVLPHSHPPPPSPTPHGLWAATVSVVYFI